MPISPDIRKDLIWWKIFLPRYNGISMKDVDEFSEPDSILSTDNCLRGCGSWFAGRYFHSEFPVFIQKQNLHINALEMLTIVVALKLWGPMLRHQKMVVCCDNLSSVKVLYSGFTRNKLLQIKIIVRSLGSSKTFKALIVWMSHNFTGNYKALKLLLRRSFNLSTCKNWLSTMLTGLEKITISVLGKKPFTCALTW